MNRTLLAFIRKELVQSLRDVRMRALLFVMPVVQMTIFGLALTTEIRDVRLAVFHEPTDRAMERLAQRFFASGWFLPAQAGSPFEAVRSGKADASLVAPPGGLERTLGRAPGHSLGRRSKDRVQLLIDATNATKARAIEAYSQSVLASFLAAEAKGSPPPAPGISLDVRILYNPAMESSLFMVPAVMGMIICLVTIILTSMSLAKERELGTFESIVSAPLENWEILLGKTLPYFLLGLVDAAIVVAAGAVLFHVPIRGPLWMLALSSMVFVVTTVCIGTLISTISANQQQAMMGSFLFLFTAMLLSGMMFPVENMPLAIKWAALLNPLKYFITLMRNILLKGGDPQVVYWNLAVLATMAAAVGALSVRRFRQTLN